MSLGLCLLSSRCACRKDNESTKERLLHPGRVAHLRTRIRWRGLACSQTRVGARARAARDLRSVSCRFRAKRSELSLSLLGAFVYASLLPGLLRMVVNIEDAMLPVLGPCLVMMGSRVVIRQRPSQAKRVMNKVAHEEHAKGAMRA